MPERKGKEIVLTEEQESLSNFFIRIWQEAIRESSGKTTYVIRFPVATPLPPLSVVVSPLIEKNLSKWLIMTRRLFVTTADKARKFGLTLREGGGPIKAEVPFIVPKRGKELITPSILKYSVMEGVVDMEPRESYFMSAEPEQGRGGLRFRIGEIFTDSRDVLVPTYNRLIDTAAKKRIDQIVRSQISQTEMSTMAPLNEVLAKFDSTPLTVIELVGRVTYYDEVRSLYQPINLGGFRLVETLDRAITIEGLVPWVRYDAWQEFQVGVQENIADEFRTNFGLLDRNLTKLASVLR